MPLPDPVRAAQVAMQVLAGIHPNRSDADRRTRLRLLGAVRYLLAGGDPALITEAAPGFDPDAIRLRQRHRSEKNRGSGFQPMHPHTQLPRPLS